MHQIPFKQLTDLLEWSDTPWVIQLLRLSSNYQTTSWVGLNMYLHQTMHQQLQLLQHKEENIIEGQKLIIKNICIYLPLPSEGQEPTHRLHSNLSERNKIE